MSYSNNNPASIFGNSLAWYSMNLLRGQMVSQLLGTQPIGGLSLNDFILGTVNKPERRSGTAMMNDALTGLIRSDAGMLKQASKNVKEGQSILKQGGAALSAIAANLARMQEIAETIAGDPTQQSILTPEYLSLAESISGIIESTSYNGMSLLDGSKWGNDPDERITDNLNDTGTLSLQAGNSPTSITLYDLQNFKNLFSASDIVDGTAAGVAAHQIGEYLGTISAMQQSYEARAGLLATEAASLERQADILTEAAARAKPNNEESFKAALLELLLGERGKFFQANF
jgi:flagellin